MFYIGNKIFIRSESLGGKITASITIATTLGFFEKVLIILLLNEKNFNQRLHIVGMIFIEKFASIIYFK